jgi:hypothetical protein
MRQRVHHTRDAQARTGTPAKKIPPRIKVILMFLGFHKGMS